MMVTGMPRLKNVGGQGASWGSEVGAERRFCGKEDENMGLSVRRLWIRVFLWLRVPTPGVNDVGRCVGLEASWGVIRMADEDGGSIPNVFLINWMFSSAAARVVASRLEAAVIITSCSSNLDKEFGLILLSNSLQISPYSCSRLMKTCGLCDWSIEGIPPCRSSTMTRSKEISFCAILTFSAASSGSSVEFGY